MKGRDPAFSYSLHFLSVLHLDPLFFEVMNPRELGIWVYTERMARGVSKVDSMEKEKVF